MAHQRHQRGAMEGQKDSTTKRIALVQRGSNKVLVDINKVAAATENVKTKKKGNLVQHVISTRNLNEWIRKRSSIDKKIIFCKGGSKTAACRKIKALCRDMENTDKKYRNFSTSGGMENTFHKNLVQQKILETPHMNLQSFAKRPEKLHKLGKSCSSKQNIDRMYKEKLYYNCFQRLPILRLIGS